MKGKVYYFNTRHNGSQIQHKILLKPVKEYEQYINSIWGRVLLSLQTRQVSVNFNKWRQTYHKHNIWVILTSHNIILLPIDVKGFFIFALISYPMDESFSNLTWRLFSIWTIFDLKQAKSEIPRLYAIFQLKLCLSTKMKPLILGAKITICPWNFRYRSLCNETLSFGSRFRIWNLRKIQLLL